MRWQGVGAFSTLPGMLAHVASAYANSAALSWREAGYWRRMSTEEFAGQVRRFCLGLHELGLRKGDCVGILAPSSPSWLVADLGIMAAGGVSVPMFPNLCDEHLVWEVENTGMRILIVIGEAQWQAVKPHAKRFHRIIVKHASADRGNIVDFQALFELGDKASERDPQLYARLRDAVQPGDLATIIHTSGSTGKPKGVELTQANLAMQLAGSAERFPLDPANDRALSCLPLAHVFERMVMYYYLAAGIAVFFGDDVKNTGALLREIKPTVITMVPRLIEKLYARIAADVDAAGVMRRSLGHWALDQAAQEKRNERRDWSFNVADSLVFRKIRAALGGNIRYLIVGGAALAPALERFLTNIGLPVLVGYGLTEASPTVAVNYVGGSRLGTVGKAFPGVEVRIGERDEILARGPGIMRGYHRDAAATAAVIDAEGWLHTGDCGRFDGDGYLSITGRLKELHKTSNGKYVSPVPIEQALVACPLVDMAMVIADGRPCVSALLFPNPDGVRHAKERHGLAQLDDVAFLASPSARAEVEAVIAATNKGLSRWELVRHWRFAPAAPTIEGGELTPTMKLRRHVVEQKYHDLIEAMYREGAAVVETA